MPEMSSKIFIRMQIFFTKNQTNTLNQNLTVYAFMQNPNRTLLGSNVSWAVITLSPYPKTG